MRAGHGLEPGARASLPPAVLAYPVELEATVAVLQTQVAALQARLAQNSSYSSRPASSDPLWQRPARSRRQ